MKRWLHTLIIVLIVAELTFQTLSLAQFIAAKRQENTRWWQYHAGNWYIGKSENLWWHTESKDLYAEYHPFLSWVYRPISTPHIHFLKDGSRLTAGNPSKPDSQAQSIYFFGGSTAAGMFVSDDQTIPSYLAGTLNTAYPGRFVVTNYGQFGYNNSQEIQKLILLLKDGNVPNTVIFYDGCNELVTNSENMAPSYTLYGTALAHRLGNIRSYGLPPQVTNTSMLSREFTADVFSLLVRYVKLVRYPVVFVRSLLGMPGIDTPNDRMQELGPTEENEQAYSKRMVDQYVKNARVIDGLSKLYGFRYMLVWQPLAFNKPLTPQESHTIKPDDTIYANVYKSATEALEAARLKQFFNIENLFSDQKDTPLYINDYCHVAPEGNAIVSKTLLQILSSEGML